MRCYVFAITKNEEDNIEDFYVMDLNYGNTKIISYGEMRNYLYNRHMARTVMWDFKNKKWVDGENLQLTIEGIIKTGKNNKITDNLESLPTFIL